MTAFFPLCISISHKIEKENGRPIRTAKMDRISTKALASGVSLLSQPYCSEKKISTIREDGLGAGWTRILRESGSGQSGVIDEIILWGSVRSAMTII